MERIDRIRLSDVLPKVFEGDADYEERHSDIWRTKVTFDRGSLYTVDAASGTGKTSLCSFLFGIRRDYSGTIFFNDTDIRTLSVADWCDVRRRHIAYLTQELDVFPELTAIDNVLLKNRLTDFRSESEIRDMFARLEIDNRVDVAVGRMSVGQRQRVALIRALCQPFDFIILDEPVSHLDSRNNRLCADLAVSEAASRGAGVISTSVGNPLAMQAKLVQL